MLKKALTVIFSVLLLANTCGCIAVMAGAAGGIGTAAWLMGKISQNVNVSFEKSLEATRKALNSLRLDINKETLTDEVAQIKSEYTDGRVIWIDIHRLTEASSRIEIRVGAKGDKDASLKILKRIMQYL